MISQPTPAQIRAARTAAGQSRPHAAGLVHAGASAWRKWESDCDSTEHRAMPLGLWELYLIKIDQYAVTK